MSIFLLDKDTLYIDLRKESVLKHFSKEHRIKIAEFCKNLTHYNKDGNLELNLKYIQEIKDNNYELFDSVIRKTNTRIV